MNIPGLRSLRTVTFAGLFAATTLATALAQTATYTDAQLNAFIDAAHKVAKVMYDWQPRLQAAKTPEEATQLRQTAQKELVEAVNSTDGLTVEQYQAIGRASESDPALQQRIVALLEARGPKQPPQ